MKRDEVFQGFIDPGGSQGPPAFAPGVAVRASMEISKMQLVKYDAACRAIAEARTIDEVKEITNQAEAARAYAHQAKNRTMELDAIEIRVRAERRLGQILLVLRTDSALDQEVSRGVSQFPFKLADMGVDRNLSGPAQRLAKLPTEKFDDEIEKWRSTAETAQRIEIPLQRYRVPSIVGDRQRVAVKLGRHRVNPEDPLDRFRAMDGRRVADWRVGELDSIDQLAARMRACVASLKATLPVANPDPLDTMEMIFRDRKSLSQVLKPIWDESICQVDTGMVEDRRSTGRRKCNQCGTSFLPSRRYPNRPGTGLFCSRSCASKAQRSKCGTSV